MFTALVLFPICVRGVRKQNLPVPCLSHETAKQSHYLPGQAQNFLAGLRFQISSKSAHKGGKAVSPTHQPSLPQGNISGTHLC